MKVRYAPWLWASPAVTMLLALVAWPVWQLIRLSLCRGGGGEGGFGIGGSFYQPGTWTLNVYASLASERYFWEILGFTIWLGVVTAALCILLAYPTAHFIWRLRGTAKAVALALVIVPKLASLLVTVYGLKLILDDHGPVNALLRMAGITNHPVTLENNVIGVVIGETILVLPYAILLLWVGLERIDRHLVMAARGLGASAWEAFLHVTLPLSLPALGSATLVSLIWGLGAFISPYLLGSPQQITLAVDVQRQMYQNMNWPRGAAEGVCLVLTLIVVAAFYNLPQRRFLKGLKVEEEPV